ncbi:glycosyltransferase [Microcoleus asticus]|uniref:Mycofactocin biosynthesis glycosyltransferase MftF n=1 Tax=Microcoleus asticus IPMA8 TaxID=2563858 RepID=A0ABX2D270_9CYAN|nr:glycosyltransferase [Microcoleus asticus]NQE36709.1 putative mycofactocin biosynthesis glycosyltransferase MftF [Microcoleus asticus IPMA8]
MTKMFLPDVSVIVPIYNGEGDLPDLIECLRSQTYPIDSVEYLLVDNNSRDRTSTIIQTAASNPPSVPPLVRGGINFNRITICHLTENQIQSSYAARNQGIRASTGEIIAFTDADCRPESDWLENLVKPFVDLEVGISAGEILALPGKTILEQHSARENTLSQKHTLAHHFCPYGQTANLAVRRLVLETLGLFRPHLTSGGDADLCWRILRETSYKLYFAENAIVRHRHRSTIKQLQSQWYRYGESNKYLHELHGVDLMREFTTGEYFYRLARWVFKEFPVAAAKSAIGRADLVDLFNTPIGLLSVRARAIGQRQAKLPESAWDIERL